MLLRCCMTCFSIPPGCTRGRGKACLLHAHISISSKHLETPGNVLHECGCHRGTWGVLEAPLEQSRPHPKALQRREDVWVQLGAQPGRAFVSLRSPQHRDPGTQRGREARGRGGGGLPPFCADKLIPNARPFFPCTAWPLHLSLSISHCLN